MEKKQDTLDALLGFDVMKLKQGKVIEETVSVATEILHKAKKSGIPASAALC